MVDFTGYFKRLREKAPLGFTGTLRAWTLEEGQTPDQAQKRTCVWEIGPFHACQGDWVTFNITKGGVTGYESFVLKDDNGFCVRTLEEILGGRNPYWAATAAGGGGRLEMRVPIQYLCEAVCKWLQAGNSLISICPICRKIYNIESGEETKGGLSQEPCSCCLERD